MAKVDDLFLKFLSAQNHSSALNSVDKDDVSDATINYVFGRYKSEFDAWKIIVPPYKDAYGHVEDYMLAAAEKDPNFTQNDMKRVEEEHKKEIDAYTGVAQSWYNDPVFNDLLASDIKLEPRHLAKQRLESAHYQNRGYSYPAAEKIALNYVATIAFFEKRAQIATDKSLTDYERKKQLESIDEKINRSRTSRLDTAKADCLENQPERLLMHMLRDYQRGKISQDEALLKADFYIKRIVEIDGSLALAKEMSGSLYQKVLKNDAKEVFERALKANGMDTNTLERMAQDIGRDLSVASLQPQKMQTTPNVVSLSVLNNLGVSR